MDSFLKKLRELPYETRLRILWVAAAIIGVVLFVALQPFFRLDKIAPRLSENNLVAALKAGAQNAQESLSKLKSDLTASSSGLINLPANYSAVALTGFYLTPDKNLVVNFTVQNPTLDILVFLKPERDNVLLKDGETETQPVSILTPAQEPFPYKILSKKTVAGQIIFPQPQNDNLIIVFSNLFFESRSDATFQETLELDAAKATPAVQGPVLPRQ